MNNYLAQLNFLTKKYKINPSRSKGQNFLIDEKIFEKIIATGDLEKDDRILEVGPGLGFLTTELLKNTNKVLAVELDQQFLPILEKLKAVNKNLEIINDDVLKITNKEIAIRLGAKEIEAGIFDYKIISNLPYNISSIFLRKFLSYTPRPKYIVVLLQKELAERIVAVPGEMSLLSVSVQFYGQPLLAAIVPKENFWPAPEIDSAIVKVEIINPKIRYSLAENFSEKEFWRLVKIGFSSKRKKLKNNLMNGFRLSGEKIDKVLKSVGLAETVRAQELAIGEWLKIYDLLTP